MVILSILLAIYTEVKVSPKSRKTMAYTNLSYNDQGLAVNTRLLKILHSLKVLPCRTIFIKYFNIS